MLNRNIKGQTGEAMVWIVATLIIFLLLAVSIYAASFLAKTKIISYSEQLRTQDVVMEKSLFAYFLIENSETKNEVYNSLIKMKEEKKFYGPEELFELKYKKIENYLENKNEE